MTQLMCKCVTPKATQTNILGVQEPAWLSQCRGSPLPAVPWCLISYPLIATCPTSAPCNTLTTGDLSPHDRPAGPAGAPVTPCWTWPTQPMRRCTISTAPPGCGQESQQRAGATLCPPTSHLGRCLWRTVPVPPILPATALKTRTLSSSAWTPGDFWTSPPVLRIIDGTPLRFALQWTTMHSSRKFVKRGICPFVDNHSTSPERRRWVLLVFLLTPR